MENKPSIEKEKSSPLSCMELLRDFEEKEDIPMGKKLQFYGVGDNDVYNISKPFIINNETVMTGRVESRESTATAQVMFFKLENDFWTPIEGAPVLKLEDGFRCNFKDETIIGGVEAYANPTEEYPDNIDYQTVFYRGNDLSSLKKFATGPKNMKDIRLIETGGKLGVFTRPQGDSNGVGKIAYTELNNLEELTAENILKAKNIENQFNPDEWGGVNELHHLADGRIGCIGHIAHRDEEGVRHYYATSFVYNPITHEATPMKIIATRKNFPAGDAKNSELGDVIFPGGLARHDNGTATLYAGLSDVEAGSIEIADPFL